eukprot:TRINITY_DN8698_c0_g1_i1.p2 TRINITY_DN8698_c0_g1~~TRINITY_DN8698_c0_g1_i1.p2  ORF type:complete len:374 (+),score=112.45 TRINITY_DN8698_c0_g1_i1:120-1124(+)
MAVQAGDAARFNDALVLLKPQACNDAAIDYARSFLLKRGVQITTEGDIDCEYIGREGIVDSHYRALGGYAMRMLPAELPVEDKRKGDFAQAAGKSWEAACSDGSAINLAEAMRRLEGMSPQELEKQWRAGKAVKLAPGCYVAQVAALAADGQPAPWVVNGFYGAMRAKFTQKGTRVHYYRCLFPEQSLSWATFRQGVLGDSDPAKAHAESIRAAFCRDWQQLGLTTEVCLANNAVHASAGPVEGLAERRLWLRPAAGAATEDCDPLVKELRAAGVPEARIEAWARNDTIPRPDGALPAFDLTEEMDTSAAVSLIVAAESVASASPPAAKRPRLG